MVQAAAIDDLPANLHFVRGRILEKLGRFDEAMEEFHSLIGSNPEYAAGYYHAGRTLERIGKTEEARAMYQKGIEVTTRTGDAHTRSELQAALDLLF